MNSRTRESFSAYVATARNDRIICPTCSVPLSCRSVSEKLANVVSFNGFEHTLCLALTTSAIFVAGIVFERDPFQKLIIVYSANVGERSKVRCFCRFHKVNYYCTVNSRHDFRHGFSSKNGFQNWQIWMRRTMEGKEKRKTRK